MKFVFIFVIFLTTLMGFGQNQDLFDRNWYAKEMVFEGEPFPIPETPANRPEGCVVGMHLTGLEPYDTATIQLAICYSCSVDIYDITNTEFRYGKVACLTCVYCGPCNPEDTYPQCVLFIDFETAQNEFYTGEDPVGLLMYYEIEELSNGHLKLTVSKDNGDYIVYGTEEVLPVSEYTVSPLALYPNPSSSVFTISYDGIITDIKVFDVHGKIINLDIDKNLNADASVLTSGVYFVKITDQEGNQSIAKLVKH